jgi:hypothetical protein
MLVDFNVYGVRHAGSIVDNIASASSTAPTSGSRLFSKEKK